MRKNITWIFDDFHFWKVCRLSFPSEMRSTIFLEWNFREMKVWFLIFFDMKIRHSNFLLERYFERCHFLWLRSVISLGGLLRHIETYEKGKKKIPSFFFWEFSEISKCRTVARITKIWKKWAWAMLQRTSKIKLDKRLEKLWEKISIKIRRFRANTKYLHENI